MTTSAEPVSAIRTRLGWPAITAAVLLLVTAGFQAALALGAPFGRAAWGGVHTGTVPTALRVASGVAAIVYVVLALIALDRLAHGRVRRWILRALAIYSVIGVLLNAASPSWLETVIWVPVTLALAITLWLASSSKATQAVILNG